MVKGETAIGGGEERGGKEKEERGDVGEGGGGFTFDFKSGVPQWLCSFLDT